MCRPWQGRIHSFSLQWHMAEAWISGTEVIESIINTIQADPENQGLREKASTLLPTRFGDMRIKVYGRDNGPESMAIISGAPDARSAVPVRVHSACLTAEVLGSLKCDCKSQLDYALQYIADQNGLLIYLPQEGRGVGLINKIKAYALQEQGLDTVDANRALGLPDDARKYNDAAEILRDLGYQKIRLLTNNPLKVSALCSLGIDVCERVPLPLMANEYSLGYLKTKRTRMGHLFEIDNEANAETEPLAKMSRPVVHVNFALGQIGQMASGTGKSLPLSCAQDWRRVHELREYYSAVVVGARTWQLDSPQLTARREYLGRKPRRQPERVIFAGKNECEIHPDERRTFIVGAGSTGEGVIRIKSTDHQLAGPLKALHDHGISSILVEGGLTLLRSFISEGQVDHLTIYVRTHCSQKAAAAITEALPGLPVHALHFEGFGEGILVSGSDLQLVPVHPV